MLVFNLERQRHDDMKTNKNNNVHSFERNSILKPSLNTFLVIQ